MIDQQVKSYHSSLAKHYFNIRCKSVMKLHFFNGAMYFLARIDQQAEIYHSILSKQDSTTQQQTNKQ